MLELELALKTLKLRTLRLKTLKLMTQRLMRLRLRMGSSNILPPHSRPIPMTMKHFHCRCCEPTPPFIDFGGASDGDGGVERYFGRGLSHGRNRGREKNFERKEEM